MLGLFPSRRAAIDARAHVAATSPLNDRPQPTDAQMRAGNYQHGHVQVQGLRIAIENPAGSVRSGVTAEGQIWRTTLQNHYGRLKGSVGADGDQVDVFLGPHPESELVFVIDQVINGRFDESKVIVGALSEAEARAIYLANYQTGWQGLGAITALPIGEFKQWLEHHDTRVPMASNRVPLTQLFVKARLDADGRIIKAHVGGYWRRDPRTGRKVFVASHERADLGPGAQFVSPNTGRDLTIGQALGRRTSNKQREKRAEAEAIDRAVGLDSTHQDALGDWSHGMENSFYVVIRGRASWSAIVCSTAQKSKALGQCAGVAVQQKRGAAGALYTIEIDGRLHGDVRSLLDRYRIQHRTIVKIGEQRWMVAVASEDHSLDEVMLRLSEEVDSDVKRDEARVEVIGDRSGESLEHAFAEYDRLIALHAPKVSGAIHRHDRQRDHRRADDRPRPARPPRLIKALAGAYARLDAAGRLHRLVKAANEVLHPGSRGGHYHVDHAGRIRYDAPASPHIPVFHGATSVRQVAEVTKQKSGLFAGRPIASTDDTAEIFRDVVNRDRERFWMLHLAGSGRALAVECISQGSLTASIVHPREVFKNAVQLGTKRVAFVHNHPSGDTFPSPEDMAITRRLREVAPHLGIDVMHHVVVGTDGYTDVDDPQDGRRAWPLPDPANRRQLREVEGHLERGTPDTPIAGVFGMKITGSTDAAQIGRQLLDPGDKIAVALLLDSKHRVLGVYPVAHDEFDAGFESRLTQITAGNSGAALVLVASADGPEWQLGTDRAHRVAQQVGDQVGLKLLDTVAVGPHGHLSVTNDGTVQ
ncbi:MAG: JAB domain-containing protein, partial [Casimicrobiaceae bacterium]